jgi:tetratricopeptide (TPR) repeat protein
MGDITAATEAFQRAATLSQGEVAYFWRSTPLREQVMSEMVDDMAKTGKDGWTLLTEGDLAASRQFFKSELVRIPNSVEANRGLAAVALAEGDVDSAAYYLQVALFIGPTYDAREYLRAGMDWASMAAADGDLESAVHRAGPVLDAIRRETFWGFGRFGTADYGWYVYYRESFLQDILPQIATAGLPDSEGNWMLEVASWYRLLGNSEKAQEICVEVIQLIPDNIAATECLHELD